MAITISATQGYTQATRDTTWSTTTTQRIGRTVVSTTSKPYYALRFAVTSTLALSDLTLAITGGTNFYDAGTPTIYARVTTDSSWRPTTSSTGTECTLNPSYTAVGKGTIDVTVSTAVAANTTTYVWLFTTGASAAYFAYYPISTGSTASAEAVFTGTVQTYTVSYNGNAKSGTTVSNVPASQTKTYGTSLTLRATQPTSTGVTSTITVSFNANNGTTTKSSQTATKTQPYTFGSWNTAAGGGGTSYAPGGSYTANAAATLYAQWTAGTPTYTTVTMPTTSQCTRTGYTLLGFATSSSATTAAYSPGTAYTITSTQTLYAVWQIITYTVSYNGNTPNASSTVSNVPSSQVKTYGAALTLTSQKPTATKVTSATFTVSYNGNGGTAGRASDTATKSFTYTFKNWNTAAGGTGTTYASGAAYTANAAATLYAQWNTGTSTTAVTLPSATRTGYTFLGWATSSTATTAQYSAGASYTPSGNVTLYAVWKAQSLVEIGNGSTFVPHEIYIANGTSFDRYIAYIANGTGWDQYM